MKKRIKAGEIPSGSMADIAFLLLIFFLVTTTIDMDKGLGLVLPPKGEEKEIPKKNICELTCVNFLSKRINLYHTKKKDIDIISVSRFSSIKNITFHLS